MNAIFLLCLLFFWLGFPHFSINGQMQRCYQNRRIYDAKQGFISDGDWNYGDNHMCEWLIKGNVGELITATIQSANIECSYDYLHIHDGDSIKAPLLASITGEHQNIVIKSSSNMMFITLVTDSNTNLKGFELTYSITECPSNCSNNATVVHGVCDKGQCVCYGKRFGDACQYEWCKNHACNQAAGHGKCNAGDKKCECNRGYYGESCSIEVKPNTGLGQWYQLTEYSDIFEERAGHTSEYISAVDKLFIFGGHSLKKVYDDLIAFDFQRNQWQQISSNGSHPSAVYKHHSAVYKDCLIIFGGELSNHSLSNQLWMFNTTTNAWMLLSNDASIPGIVGHELICAQDKLFVIGGRTNDNQTFSMLIYVYDMLLRSWSTVQPNYGKTSQLRLFGHSASYYEATGSIIVYGGYAPVSVWKTASITSKVYAYNIKNNVWSMIGNSKSKTAFHRSLIVGNYLVIHGGFTSKCVSKNEILYFNLHCNQWVTLDDKSTISSDTDKYSIPVYLHGVSVKDNQVMIVSGGFNNAQSKRGISVYKFPEWVVRINETTKGVLHGSHCSSLQEKDTCIKDPNCQYCDDTTQCFSTFGPSPNKQCPLKVCVRHCSIMSSCEACAAQSGCSWCTLKSVCYVSDTVANDCKMDVTGWWGAKEGTVITTPALCSVKDKPSGLTEIRYQLPANEAYPDYVKVRSNTSWDDGIKRSVFKVEWRGKIYPFLHDDIGTYVKLYIQSSAIKSMLLFSTKDRSSTMGKVVEAPFQREDYTKEVTKRQDSSLDIFPVEMPIQSNKNTLWYGFKLIGNDTQNTFAVKILVYWYMESLGDYKIIDSGYLEAFSTDNCSQHVTCMGCVSDALCGWCGTSDACVIRTSTCKDETGRSRFLQHKQEQCEICSDYFDCRTCSQDKFCKWQQDSCVRAELYRTVLTSNRGIIDCNLNCNSFSHDTCLKRYGCFWCTNRNTCLAYVDYHPQNPFSECYTYKTRNSPQIPQQKCSGYSTCDDCMPTATCGWCFDENDPRKGMCVTGDFSGPAGNCSFAGNHSNWRYDRCPDVNECSLKLDKCKENSTCVNTDGSYLCQCNQGYEGDGKVKCNKTCWPSCGAHGKCNLSNFQCECDLGWKGINCSIDCGCNGHSTCVNLTGVCDKCRDFTHGQYCQYCVNGSYGNATTDVGCQQCSCNGNGDASKNFCDKVSGECFCLNNTKGKNCEECLDGFVYDFRRKRCVLGCERSNIHLLANTGYISAWDDVTTSYCQWIISVKNTTHDDLIYDTKTSDENMLLRIDYMRTSCFDSYLQVFDGVPPNPRTQLRISESPFKLLATICGDKAEQQSLNYRSTSGIFTIIYHGNIAFKDNHVIPISKQGFMVEYTALKCPLSCPPPFECTAGGVCQCPSGRMGPNCENEVCPNGCYSNLDQGSCDQNTKLCKCKPGFTGIDCNITKNHQDGFHLRHLSNYQRNYYQYSHYGSSMVYYQGNLYMFGNVNLGSEDDKFLIYDTITLKWLTVKNDNSTPKNRFFHCSFVYKDAMFVFGGLTKTGVSQELFVYNFTTSSWSEVAMKRSSEMDGRLTGHTCTVVDSKVYLIGGHSPLDGLSEFMYIINLETYQFYAGKFDGLQPFGIYGHVAMYDQASGYIYVHGGVGYQDEHIGISSQTFAITIGDYPVWDVIESHPSDKAIVPRLVGHVSYIDNDKMFILGGYSDLIGYNSHLYIWKLKCNRWIKVPNGDLSWKENNLAGGLFAPSSSYGNRTFFIFGGFSLLSQTPSLYSFAPADDVCRLHGNVSDCVSDQGCQWCNLDNSATQGFCHQSNKPVTCPHNTTAAEPCTHPQMKSRDCGTFSTCTSCMSGYSENNKRCHWCRCKHRDAKRICISANQMCPCQEATADVSINTCHKGDCFTSTCKNCVNNCFWTSYFKYSGETQRIYDRDGLFPYNCFTKDLISYIESSQQANIKKQATSPCPNACSTFTSCEKCIAAKGDFAGSKSCTWSSERMQCLSIALLPLKCSIGRCGTLYTSDTKCPAVEDCSSQTTCLSCLTNPTCGWCAKGNKGYGTCVPGSLLEPHDIKCGISPDTRDVTVIESPNSVNYTWAFSLCPLEDECANDHNTCGPYEICEDLINGFRCLCKKGYERLNGQCRPICKPGCGNGTCTSPGVCKCFFGWTGQYCNVSCRCNGHSDCLDEQQPHICTGCRNNTQGSTCDRCLPMFVGDPRNGGKCKSCFDFCQGNSDICMLGTNRTIMKDAGVPDNRTAILQWLKHNVQIGPQFEEDAVCLLCGNDSTGNKCNQCVDGFYKDGNDVKCVKCKCNGHGSICDTSTGLDCQCTHNTMSNKLCKSDCQNDQCSKCVPDYVGDPKDQYQCYKRINTDRPESVSLTKQIPLFFAATPSFTNVNMRITVDLLDGDAEVFITDVDQLFKLQMNESRLIVGQYDKLQRKRRAADGLVSTEFMPSQSALRDRITTFVTYEQGVLWIYNVRKRLVINIDHSQHNLRKKYFYLVLKSTNSSRTTTKARVYFRQDLPRIDLLLFFLVLSVILLFILSGFCIGMKIRVDFIRNAQNQMQRIELNAMRSRPLAPYTLLFQHGEDVVRKRKNRLHSPCQGNSSNRNKINPSHGSSTRLVLPVAIQETEDNLASVVSTIVQFPKNEISEWNLSIGAGICQMQNQQLLQVRSNQPRQTGRRIQTRIHATTIHS